MFRTPILNLRETFSYLLRHYGQVCRSVEPLGIRRFCPRWRPGVRAIVLMLFVPSAGFAAAAQQAAGRVMLASVSDRNNRPTVDVGPDDFVVAEGNDEREILAVRVADYPIAVLIDNGARTAPIIAELRRAAGRFVTRIGQRPVVIGTLAEPVQIVANFADSRQHVLDQIEHISPSSSDRLAPLAAVTKAAEMISEFDTPFAVVVVISARPIDATEATPSDRLSPILDSGASVHVIALRTTTSSTTDPAAPPDLLRQLADQTLGQYVTIYTPASFPIALDSLADRLATEIMIDYLVPPDSMPRDVRIGIRIPGAKVRGLGVSK
jgi:hypothetical protein